MVGTKRLRLYAAEQEPHLHRFAAPLPLRNTSAVDAERAAPEHAAFAAQPYWECVLQPGQALFIPRRVWHWVRAEATSVSVSWWW